MKNRLKEKLKTNKFTNRLNSSNISLRYLLLDFSLLIIIVVISYNVFLAYNRGVQNQIKLQEEEEKLAKLQQENAELSEQENYYRSIEFRKAYARESLNLTGKGEKLYQVIREDDMENKEETTPLFDQNTVDELEYWRILILDD